MNEKLNERKCTQEDLDKEKVLKGLEALDEVMRKNQCYACSHEYVEAVGEFGTNIIRDAIILLKEQPEIARCKDCIYFDDHAIRIHGDDYGNCDKLSVMIPSEWFCADGKRR